jgi:hypothetical protein
VVQRILALGVGSLLALVLAEGVLRALGISHPSLYTTDPCCGLALRPGASGWSTREGRAFIEVNSDGLRDVEHAQTAAPGVVRIAVMGDSYTLARQVALDDTFWNVAERALGACPHLPGDRVEMINFGVVGYSTAQELRMYERRARKYAPDLVVLAFLSGNDVSDNYAPLDANPMRPYYAFRDGRLVLDDSFLERSAYRKRQTLQWKLAVEASTHSRVIQLAGELRNRLKAAALSRERSGAGDQEAGLSHAVYREPPSARWEEAWNLTEAILTRFRDTVRADGAEFFVLSLSNGVQVDPDPRVRERSAAAMDVADLGYPERRLGAHLTAIGVPHRLLAPVLAREAERSGECVHGFENAEPCRGHWNERGHRLAGEALAASLCAGWQGSSEPEVAP